MNAAEVLAHDLGEWFRAHGTVAPPTVVAALLAHGEQGVAILPDGTLWTLDGVGYSASGRYDSPLYRLVPVSAEAGDTDA